MAHFLKVSLCVVFLGLTSNLFAAESIAGFFPLEVEAQGMQESIMTIPEPGRYSIQVNHPLGTSITLVDKMTGPGKEVGERGVKNGRLDVFLENGEYKLQLHSPKEGDGKIKPHAYAFEEQNKETHQLIQEKLISSELQDLQQRSYWLHVESQQWVYIEAAGKHLHDLRLWQNGRWLINDLPKLQKIEPVTGKPLNYIQLKVNLGPGIYRITAYGGTGEKWALNAKAHPFYIRTGLPKLAHAGRQSIRMNPFGIDYWLVPHTTDFFRLELDQRGEASMQLAFFNYGDDVTDYLYNRSINNKDKYFVIESELSSRQNYDKKKFVLVSVFRPANENYTLQHFNNNINRLTISESGLYWLSTIQAGKAGDFIDPSFVLTQTHAKKKRSLKAHHSVVLDQKNGWKGKVNFTQELTLHVDVKENGEYIPNINSGKARFRFEPYFIQTPHRYEPNEYKINGEAWVLQTGLYVLTIKPFGKNVGIKTLELMPAQQTKSAITANQLGYIKKVNLNKEDDYFIEFNRQGTKNGLVVRSIPIDLTRTLPITLRAGQNIDVEVVIPEDGKVTLLDDEGVRVPYRTNSKVETNAQLKKGPYLINVSNSATSTQSFTLSFKPSYLLSNRPLIVFDAQKIRQISKTKRLVKGKYEYLDLAEQEQKYFNFDLKRSELIQLESSGLLHTNGVLRTQTSTRLNNGEAYASGRNLLIQEYLRPGTYQLQINAQGKTHGHLGVFLDSSVLHPGGALPLDIPAGISLKAGHAVEYWLPIETFGHYHIQALGLQNNWRIRLEDEEGWPIITPGQKNQIQTELKPGKYRILILPQSVDSRLMVVVKKIESGPDFKGHGPHIAPLNSVINHSWLNKENSQEVDRWHFTINADSTINIKLESRMQGKLLNQVSGEVIEKQISKEWSKKLPAGNYEMQVQPLRSTSYIPYSLHIYTTELLVGQSRSVNLPSSITLSVKGEQDVNVFSIGNRDVVGALYNSESKLVARNDDTQDGWNFQIIKKLKSGFYRLDVTATQTGKKGSTTVVVSAPTRKDNNAVTLPASIHIDNSDLHIYPLVLPKENAIITIASESVEKTALRLEKFGNDWQTITRQEGKNPVLATVVEPLEKYRLIVWSSEGRGAPIDVKIAVQNASTNNENDLKNGLKFDKFSLFERTYGMAEVKLDKQGVFTFSKNTDNVYVTTQRDRGFHRLESSLVVHGQSIWLMKEHDAKVAAQRLFLKENEPLNLQVESGKPTFLDIATLSGPVLVKAISRHGIVGVGFEEQIPYGNFMEHSMGTSVTVRTSENDLNRLVLWNATEYDSSTIACKVELVALKDQPKMPLFAGLNSVDIKPTSRTELRFNNKSDGVQITIPPHTAVSWEKDNQSLGVVWAENEAKSAYIAETIHAVIVYSMNLDPSLINLQVYQGQRNLPLITQNSIFKKHVESRGQQVIRVDPQEMDLSLHLPRMEKQFTFIADDGFVSQKIDTPIAKKGRININTDSGLLIAWLDKDEPKPWVATQETQVLWPQTIKIQSEIMKLLFHAGKGNYLHIRSDAPMIMRLKQGLLPAQIKVYKQSTVLNWYLPPGESNIQIQNILDGPVNTFLEVYSSPIIPLNEGLGAEHRMNPGGSRLFSFSLKKSTRIAVGVRSRLDVLDCTLFDVLGNVIGFGKAQMHELDAGEYLLSVDSKPDNPSVLFQPILVGSIPPTGVPVEQSQKYFQFQSEAH